MGSPSASRTFPGFARLYALEEPGASRAFRASLELTHEDALALLKGEATRTASISGRWAMGASQPGDIVWTTLALPVLLGERVVAVLRKRGFTGWDVVPVDLRGKNGEPLPTYYYLCIRGHCGPIDKSRSTKVDKIYPGGVFPIWKGLYFDETTWDGSDFFVAAGAGFKFIAEEVKLAFQNAKVKNALLTPLDEIELESMDR
jgi:hypothetical protein